MAPVTFLPRRAGRVAKYALAAPVIGWMIRNTSLLDGDGAPPALINYSGGGPFIQVGLLQSRLVTERCGITGADRILDIGCGIGRLARGLSVRHKGLRYHGVDVVRFGIDWCAKAFRDKPTYRFTHADIHNSFYNPFGRIAPVDYVFPEADGAVTCVLATSVFSHLRPETARHYIAEAGRVLAPGGRLYMTWFEWSGDGPGPGAALRFAHPLGVAHAESRSEPELAVAYARADILDWAQAAGLEPAGFHPGQWSGAEGRDFQDALVLRKA